MKREARITAPLFAMAFMLAIFYPSSGVAGLMRYWVTCEIPPVPVVTRGHMENGVNGTADVKSGKTPLMLAVENGDMEVVMYLLEHGADPSLRDRNHETALDIARRIHAKAFQDTLELHQSLHPPAQEYYAGKHPVIKAIEGGNQWEAPGAIFQNPLVVRVTGSDGRPMPNAPVKFQVVKGKGALKISAQSPAGDLLVLRTNQNGVCSAWFQAPDSPESKITIKAMTGQDGRAHEVVFEETTGSPDDFSYSPFDPNNVTATLDNEGDTTVRWTNHTSESAFIKILVKDDDDKVFHLLRILPPDTTSAVIPKKLWAPYEY